MTRIDLDSLRAQACTMMAALGGCLDSLLLIEQTLARPDDPFSDGVVTAQHLDEAALAADTLAAQASDFALELDRHAIAQRGAVEALEKGGAS